MNKEEINYWLEIFEKTRHSFMSKDGKILSFYDTFKTMKDLQNNWNKLKEYLHNQIPTDKTVLTKYIKIFEVLDKIQELEQGSDSNVKD